MDSTTEAVDQMFRIISGGVTCVMRLVTTGAFYAHMQRLNKNSEPMVSTVSSTKGRISMNEILQRGQGIAYYIIRNEDLEKFLKVADKMSILYAVGDPVHTENQKDVRQIIVPRDQAGLLDNILNLAGIGVVDRAEAEQVKMETSKERTSDKGAQKDQSEQTAPSRQEVNRQCNDEFFRQVQKTAAGKEKSEGSPTVNPPRAAQTERPDLLLKAALKEPSASKNLPKQIAPDQNQTGLETTRTRDGVDPKISEAENRPSVKEKVEQFIREAPAAPSPERKPPEANLN